ncbi:hypothetical protein BDF19DRAFT_213999 [Syncephalis fuscata]|nr:hypothetical protein BDF19DRAFT_213999 [Syncephalis fuscata]
MRDDELAQWQQRCLEIEHRFTSVAHSHPSANIASIGQHSTMVDPLKRALRDTLEQLEMNGVPLQPHWIDLLSLNQEADMTMNNGNDVTWLRDFETQHPTNVAQTLQAQLELCQQQLDERNSEVEQLNLQLMEAERQLQQLDEKVEERDAATRVAENMTALVREELEQKVRELDAVKKNAVTTTALLNEAKIDLNHSTLEYTRSNTSAMLEQNVDTVLHTNAETLVELDRLCRIIVNQQKQLQRQRTNERQSRSMSRSVSRTSSGGRDGLSATSAATYTHESGNIEPTTSQNILLELREFGVQMRELMEEHAALKQHLEEQTGMQDPSGTVSRVPSSLGSTRFAGVVTVDRVDLKALGEIGASMTCTTTSFLMTMEKLAPRLLKSILDNASSITAVDELSVGSRPVSAMSGGSGPTGWNSSAVQQLRQRLARAEEMYHQAQSNIQLLEDTLHMERQQNQQPELIQEITRLGQENRALAEEIADLEARLAQEQELHEHEWIIKQQDAGEQMEQLQQQHRQDTRKLGREIRYLQAKCQREIAFRMDFQFQKQYLLLIIGGMESR